MFKASLLIDPDPTRDIALASYVYTGLFELVGSGELRLSTRLIDPQRDGFTPGVGTFHLILESEQIGTPILICFDFHDLSSRYYPSSLERAAVYFKRQYYQPDVDELPPPSRDKVVPFGLCFPCSISRSFATVFRAEMEGLFSRNSLGTLVRDPKRLLLHLHRQLDYWRLPTPGFYEYSPSAPKEQQIIYQTRVWADKERIGDERINEERVTLIRLLRSNFGDRYVGGLIPNRAAETMYPDLITRFPTDSQSYVRLCQQSLIAIYTRGLNGAIAWKFAEYLACNDCIVSDPLRSQAPVPIRPGEHYMGFRTPEECVEACESLLSDRQRQAAMRQAAYEYYTSYVEPGAHMRDCLNRAIEHQLERAGSPDSTLQRTSR